ncbi:MAG: phosphotransferase [Sulfitobacter sp.]|nr:phosphotransferase [Sulfitobacter sp.]
MVGEHAAVHPPVVEQSVLGTADPHQIAEMFQTWCARNLHAPAADAWLWRVSVGTVAGLTLVDGRQVVVKAYGPDRDPNRITQVLVAQRHALTQGLPVAHTISGPHPLGAGYATAETALRAGRPPDLTREPDRATTAAGWVALTDAFSDDEHLASDPHHTSPAGLYPPPHSPVFDFAATATGAEWIDELARQSRAHMDTLATPEVLVHSDWRADNLRVDNSGTELVAVFDWDSLRHEQQATAAGRVAATHSITWAGPGGPHHASADDCVAYLNAIETHLDVRFTPEERAAALAAIVYGWCYTARCEHALAATGHNDPRHRMRHRLQTDGPTLLNTIT